LLDFGQVYPGISAPLALMITGKQGMLVHGTIRPVEPWIVVDTAQFDGMSTRINVRVNSMLLSNALPGQTHYSGTILISPDDDEAVEDIVVTVEMDFFDYTTRSVRRGGKTHGANLDEEDDDYDQGSITMVSPGAPTVQGTMKASTVQAQIGLPVSAKTRDSEYKAKYGQPGMNGATSSGWDPLQATPQQRMWMQRGLTFVAAFMLASLCYTIVAHLPFLAHTLPLWPSSWFILVLSGMIPAASLGALTVQWNKTWTFAQTIDRFCIGMASVLATLALESLAWSFVFHVALSPVQLVLELVIAALTASFSVSPWASNYIINALLWTMTRVRSLFMAFVVVVGGALGYLLTMGILFSWFTLFGIVVGVAVAVALVLRIDHLVQQAGP
jgi:hypothetical protein